MLRVLGRLFVVVCALWASQALALGLGDINVKSKLNQPFSASIAVLGASPTQLDALTVKLASPDEFNRAGIDRSDYLSSLKFDVQSTAGGARVVITSDQIAREPFLNFIVDAHSPDGKILREYTVLLDPPTLADSSAPAAQTGPAPAPAAPASTYTPPPAPVVQVPASSAPSITPAEAAALAPKTVQARHGRGKAAKPAAVAPAAVAETAPAPAAEAAPAAAPAASSGSTYGPIAPQETFWSIANKLRPGPQVSMDQVLLAIYRANPQAFDRGSFNGLLKGQTLQVPSLAQMQEASAAQAKGAVDAWRHGTHPASLKKNLEASESPGAPAPAPAAKPKQAKAKPAKPAAVEAKPELPAPAPVAPAAVAAPAPKPEQKPAAPAPQAAVPTPAPAPAATAPAAPTTSAAAEPAKPQSAAPTPAPSNAQTAATPPATPAPAPAAAEPPKKTTVPPPKESSLFDDSTTLLGILAFLVLVGAGYWFLLRPRKDPTPDFRAKAPPASASKPAAKGPALAPPKKAGPPAPPPLPPKPQPSKLGDTTALPDSKPPVAAPKLDQTTDFGRTLISEPPLSRTSLDDTTRVAAPVKMADTLLPVPSFEKTAQEKAASTVGSGDVDFDLTSQFEAQTLSINLDANDPLSEADFHLAYGLYDEAASLLKQALVKEPQRQDLRIKLAETYFAGGKPMEFQETAESLHGQINPTEWQKIGIMGRQLCPDSAMFKSDGNAPAPDVDFSLGDSIGPAALQVLGTTPSRPVASQGNVIDFDLDHELNKASPAVPAAAAPQAAAPAAAEKPDFDLSHFDFSAEPHPADHEGMVEFNLDELDLSKPGGDGHHSINSGDEIGTKLDLARVYADMGDNDAARGLLNEVLNTGNIAQKEEAEALIKRLSA